MMKIILAFNLIGMLLIEKPCPAQDLLRLSVRPRDMATATRTEQAGTFRLEALEVYVPQQCVGARRCPLVIHSNTDQELVVKILGDKYGMITALMTSVGDGSMEGLLTPAEDEKEDIRQRVAALDRSMKQALQTFAIDPEKIAILGGSNSGPATVIYGAQNPEVFSRVLNYTQHSYLPQGPSRGLQNQFYLSAGIVENATPQILTVQKLRDRGYPTEYMIQMREHGLHYEDCDFMGHWLEESWAIPDPKARPAPDTLGNPPLLTTQIIAQMTDFWTRFMREPDSIRTTHRRAHIREVVVPLGEKAEISTLMVDMPALAAQDPTVAAALKTAGLTARQHDSYRAALIGAYIIDLQNQPTAPDSTPVLSPALRQYFASANPTLERALKRIGAENRGAGKKSQHSITATSMVAKNAAFIRAHLEAYQALASTGIWTTP